MMWGYGYDPLSWLLMGLMMLFPLLVLIGIVLLVIWAVRRGSEGRHHDEGRYAERHGWRGEGPYEKRGEDPYEIAKRRLANGEITREEYDEIVTVLRA